ncbi:V-type proton ATPase subunit S1-like [Babylonia areolata]|uniref:V-type proton ATPase subunit S1-like n=1 Tax=Babylonia areolata TaxID=304850 RepID=UPI003FD0D175
MTVSVTELLQTLGWETLERRRRVRLIISRGMTKVKPLSDLPEPPAAGSVSQVAFHSSYLTPLQDKAAPVVVAFLQDKLHINDIAKYADVYNPDSDGGAFRNIKGHLDEHFSLELPHVENSHLALDTLQQDFPGTVLDLPSTSDLSDLDLQGEGFSLVIVHLQPVANALNEEAIFAANDELVGKIAKHLEQQNVKYTALYTAEMSHSRQQDEKRESHLNRRLQEAPTLGKKGAFYNVSHLKGMLYAYLSGVSACVRPRFNPEKPPLAFCPFNFSISSLNSSDMTVNPYANKTLSLTLKIFDIRPPKSADVFNFSLTMPFRHQGDRWVIMESSLTVGSSAQRYSVKDFKLVTHGYDPVVPLLYSFHCSSMEWYPKNMSAPVLAFIELHRFQVQPFHTPHFGFLPAQDCVGWFSAAVWMALFVVILHLLILLFAIHMLTSLSINPRFLNPKGKALTIHAEEELNP